jgi:hypothetical protein
MYVVVPFLFVYKFTDHCHLVKNQLQLTNVIPYRKCYLAEEYPTWNKKTEG